MRGITSATIVILVTSSVASVYAQNPSRPVTELADSVDNPNEGHFVHWSGVLSFSGNAKTRPRNSLRYSVCNFDPKNGLVFRWDKPGLATGWRRPLEPGKCLTMSLDSGDFSPDYNAPIIFTQNNKSRNASAYLPFLKDVAPSTSSIEAHYLQNGGASVVTFSIRVSLDNNGAAVCEIEWSQGLPAVAIAVNLPDTVLQDTVKMLASQGVRVRSGKAGDLVDNLDLANLDGAVRESTFIELSSTEGRPFSGQFSYRPSKKEPSIDPILLLDGNKGVIARSSYRAIR